MPGKKSVLILNLIPSNFRGSLQNTDKASFDLFNDLTSVNLHIYTAEVIGLTQNKPSIHNYYTTNFAYKYGVKLLFTIRKTVVSKHYPLVAEGSTGSVSAMTGAKGS